MLLDQARERLIITGAVKDLRRKSAGGQMPLHLKV